MPFDSASFDNQQLVEDLDRIAHRLRSPNGWCKDEYFSSTKNRACLHGTITLIGDRARRYTLREVLDATARARGYDGAVHFNDAPEIHHEHVLDLIREAKVTALRNA